MDVRTTTITLNRIVFVLKFPIVVSFEFLQHVWQI